MIIFIVLILSGSFLLISIVNSFNFSHLNSNDQQKLYTSETKYYSDQMLVNPTFSNVITPWYPFIEGDSTDGIAFNSTNQANFQIIGDSRTTQILLDDTSYLNWEAFNKSDLVIVPQRAGVPYYGVTSDGAWCSHWWWEGETGGQPKNTPRMNWKTNVGLPVDMSDYIITSAEFNAIINASVNQDIDTPGDTTARWTPGTVSIDQFQTYDYAQFYVEISTINVDQLNTYRIAFNQTRQLGSESLPLYDIEGYIGVFEEQAIIDALNNALAVDPGHNNFTLVLGIYMYCEDNNSGTDRDQWDDLRFKSLNLTFSYVKRIDKSTTISWNQDLDEIKGTNVQITGANLKFKYKIDNNWTEASQNSQIRIYINDRKYEQAISLIDYVYSPNFQEANVNGYNIASKILPYENFTLSIQIYLAEDFGLENDVIISITDVYLYISYTETFPDFIPEPWVFAGLFIIATMAAVTTIGYLIAYQTYLKYPIPVRKVRKYRKTLSDEKDPKTVIIERERAFKRKFQKEISNTAKYVSIASISEK
ncbi:MAG: hypothetical protein ACFFKA_16535, partial [Candidatus Thorarchaeota archaeon]